MMVNCLRCGGQKKVAGIGMIEITCPKCRGIGEHMSAKVPLIDEKPPLEIIAAQAEISSTSKEIKRKTHKEG